tara:strand:+ start:513 stop:1046 length:534 start_codon:yes stop_codon:yes gene_type:complete
MNLNLVSRIKALLTVIFSVSLLLIVGMGCEYSEETPEIEKRAQEINSVVMCPVCPGESIDQSQHPLAVQMRNIVVEELENGMNETQIKNYFVDAYGPSVLLEPPTSGINIWVWLVPPIVMVLVLGSVFTILKKTSRRGNIDDGITYSSDQDQDLINRVEFALEREGIVSVTKNPNSE